MSELPVPPEQTEAMVEPVDEFAVGPVICTYIHDQLDRRLHLGRVEQFRKDFMHDFIITLAQLYEVQLPDEALLREISNGIEAQYTLSCKQRLEQHRKHLLAGKALTTTDQEDQFSWETVPPKAREAVADNIESAPAALTLDDDLSISRMSDEHRDVFNSIITSKIEPTLRQIVDLMPAGSIPEKPLQQWTRAEIKRVYVRAPEMTSYYYFNSQGDIIKTGKLFRRLTRWLQDLIKDPLPMVSNIILEGLQSQHRIQEVATQAVDSHLAEQNATPLKSAGKVDKKAYHRAARAERARELLVEEFQQDAETEEQKTAATTTDQTAERNQLLAEEVCLTTTSLPWLEGENHVSPIWGLRGVNGVSYVVRALTPGLEEIATKSREKAHTAHDGTNEYDQIATSILARLNDGIMPFHKSSGSKPVRKINQKSDYANTPIWYNHELAPNAPRLYYTVKAASELIKPQELKRIGLKEDATCMVILAETDKGQQIEVLKKITGLSHASLKKGGAGSI